MYIEVKSLLDVESIGIAVSGFLSGALCAVEGKLFASSFEGFPGSPGKDRGKPGAQKRGEGFRGPWAPVPGL